MACLWRSEDLWDSSHQCSEPPSHLFCSELWSFCFLWKHSDCRAISPGSVCLWHTLPFPNESGFQIFSPTTACPGKLLGFQPLLVWTLTRESRPPWISSTTEFRTPCCQPTPQRRQSNCRSWELFLLSPDLQSWNSLANWPGSQLIIASRQMCEASQGCWRLTGKFYLFWSYFWCIREMWY